MSSKDEKNTGKLVEAMQEMDALIKAVKEHDADGVRAAARKFATRTGGSVGSLGDTNGGAVQVEPGLTPLGSPAIEKL